MHLNQIPMRAQGLRCQRLQCRAKVHPYCSPALAYSSSHSRQRPPACLTLKRPAPQACRLRCIATQPCGLGWLPMPLPGARTTTSIPSSPTRLRPPPRRTILCSAGPSLATQRLHRMPAPPSSRLRWNLPPRCLNNQASSFKVY